MSVCLCVLFSLSDYSSGTGYPALDKSEVSHLLTLLLLCAVTLRTIRLAGYIGQSVNGLLG